MKLKRLDRQVRVCFLLLSWRLTRKGLIEVFGGCPSVGYDR